jgi:hypothetical protein
MAWDSSRPVPWERLMREWVIYAAIMVAVFLVFFRDANLIGAITGILVSGPLYLGLGAVLAKFGYQRKSLKEMRTPRADAPTSATDERPARQAPAPTKRTSGGRNRPTSKQKRR